MRMFRVNLLLPMHPMVRMNTEATGIYAIENLYVPRAYVGATKDSFRRRRDSHLHALHAGYHVNGGLRKDAVRYGPCSFRFVILQQLPADTCMQPFEQFWIDYLSSIGVTCYNQLPAWQTVPRIADAKTLSSYPYTVFQLSQVVNVSDQMIYRCIRAGIIDAIGDGKRWLISEASFKSFPDYWRHHRTIVRAQRPLKVQQGKLRRWESYKNALC
jgi:excisionase family DNA binding protein